MDIEYVNVSIGFEIGEAGNTLLHLRHPSRLAGASACEPVFVYGVGGPRTKLRSRMVSCRESSHERAEQADQARAVSLRDRAGV